MQTTSTFDILSGECRDIRVSRCSLPDEAYNLDCLIPSSSDHPSATDNLSANRNTQLTYEDISTNDILLVTWGSSGIKQYPARCLEKNDDKSELFVHYTGWNSR